MSPPGGPARRNPSDPQIERRRRRRGALSKLLTAPLPRGAIEPRLGGWASALARAWPLLGVAIVVALLWLVWSGRTPVITPHHRPEALCFALAQARFAPPMVVEPAAAVVRGRFNEHTPVSLAVRDAMHFTDDMEIQETLYRVGDYDVSAVWLRIPGGRGHWLVLAWMDHSDLELASFRFAGDDTDLTPDDVLWGNRLKRAVLVEQYFRAGAGPAIRLRAPGGAAPRRFGPKTED